jgi:hypothetical protein
MSTTQRYQRQDQAVRRKLLGVRYSVYMSMHLQKQTHVFSVGAQPNAARVSRRESCRDEPLPLPPHDPLYPRSRLLNVAD